MIHRLHLHEDPYNKIKSGNKIYELRLYDEKRKLMQIGDIIELQNRENGEILKVEIIDLLFFKDFQELYQNLNKLEIGYQENEEANPKDMEIYYSKEETEKYGVVAIKIRII